MNQFWAFFNLRKRFCFRFQIQHFLGRHWKIGSCSSSLILWYTLVYWHLVLKFLKKKIKIIITFLSEYFEIVSFIVWSRSSANSSLSCSVTECSFIISWAQNWDKNKFERLRDTFFVWNCSLICLFFPKWQKSFRQSHFFEAFGSIQFKIKVNNFLRKWMPVSPRTMCQLCSEIR